MSHPHGDAMCSDLSIVLSAVAEHIIALRDGGIIEW